MRYYLAILLFVLLVSCANQIIEIKDSEIERQEMEIKTIKVQENGEVIVKNPEILMISPHDGELIKDSRVIVKIQPENFRIVPVG